jgi:pimeloyl-ACP methyl ester carboxylesterase/DNA-binding CsgD family transcriptional regulator
MTQEDDDIDMQIVADSYRVVSDIRGWDTMIASWDLKLAQAGYGDTLLSGEDRLRKHYGALGRLLSMTGLPGAEDPIEKAVSSVNEPAMVVSGQLRVMAINVEGRRGFGVEQGQAVSLDWLHDSFHKQVRDFASARQPQQNQSYFIVRTRIAANAEGYAEVFPVHVTGIEGRFTAIRELSVRWTPQMDHVLAEAFHLTAAEIEIAKLCYLHADVSKAAHIRGVLVRSVRAQLSSVFHKTETKSQAELLRLLSLLSMRLAIKPQTGRLSWIDPLGREAIIVRPDGRRLAYSWMGAEKGRPIVFVHGIVNGYLYPDSFEATLKEAGIKLYVPSRPGAGNSDADWRLHPCTDHVETLKYFCEALDLTQVPCAGIHAAVIPIAVLASRPDNPFSSILGLGRFLPYSQKRFAKIAATPRALLWLAANAPWAAEIVGRHGWRALVQNGVDWYIERAYGDMPFDYKTTKQPEIAALMRNACAFTFLQDHRIFFDDLVLRKTNIGDYLPSLRLPFHWMMGSADVYGTSGAGGFYDNEDINWLLQHNSRISMEQVADAGELMPYQCPDLVARRMIEMV